MRPSAYTFCKFGCLLGCIVSKEKRSKSSLTTLNAKHFPLKITKELFFVLNYPNRESIRFDSICFGLAELILTVLKHICFRSLFIWIWSALKVHILYMCNHLSKNHIFSFVCKCVHGNICTASVSR